METPVSHCVGPRGFQWRFYNNGNISPVSCHRIQENLCVSLPRGRWYPEVPRLLIWTVWGHGARVGLRQGISYALLYSPYPCCQRGFNHLNLTLSYVYTCTLYMHVIPSNFDLCGSCGNHLYVHSLLDYIVNCHSCMPRLAHFLSPITGPICCKHGIH